MSRALDPQLHTHVVAANLTRGPDGRYTALHGTPLYRAAKTAGYLYQAHLRVRVSEQLGLEWGAVRNGAAELRAIPAVVLRGFSRQRHEMERAALAGGIGLGTKAAAQAAALATRQRKLYGVDTRSWLEEIEARAGELGFGRDELQAVAHQAKERLRRGVPVARVDERAVGDQLAGPGGLTARANTFDERAVLQEFAAAAPQGATAADVREKAERFVGRPDVLRTASGELTTRDLVECEQRLITAAVGRAAEKGGFVDAAVVDRVIAASARPLNGDQAMVVRAVAGDGRGVDVVEALAGTGKTYTAAVIREVYAAAAYEVIGVAPTGRAARELGDQAGIAARTLDRLLIDLDELGDTLPDKCVIVLDEAGMAPTRQTARLLEAAAHAGAKVVAIGDSGQLASVRAGGWLRAVGARLGALRLTEVMRQRAPAERRALAALHDRRPRPYLDWATTADRIETHADATAARQQAIREWADATADVGPAEAVMIARENAPRDALNRAARELLRDQGALGEERAYGAVDVAVGDRVICRRNDRWIDVDNGTRGTVRHLADERIVIETDSHLVRDLPAGYVAEHVEHAYALTGHGMQGATVERAFVVASPRDLTAGWSYTALSRARATTRLLIHPDQPDLKRVDVAPIGNGSPATDDLLARVRRQMTVRDDEDLAIEQLEPAGRADDPRLTAAGVGGPTQEQGAAAAEPAVADTAPERLAALRSRIEQLTAQRDALPIAELHRVDELDARISACTQRQAACAEALAELPAPRWRLGRRTDPYIVDRVRHRSMLAGVTDQLEQLTPERARLVRELGAPDQVRSELEGLNRAIRTLMRERRSLGDEVAQREHGLDLATGRDRDTGVEIGGI